MRFVAVKSEAKQASAVIFRTRDILVAQRTQIINALRGHLREYGLIAPQGRSHVETLIPHIRDLDSDIPEAARECLLLLVDALQELHEKIIVLDKQVAERAKRDEVARRLMSIPGVGPMIATATRHWRRPPVETFRSGRDFSAWIGLTPIQKSTGGKDRLGRTSRMAIGLCGVFSSSHVAAWCAGQDERGSPPAGSWLARMLTRKPPMLVIVALANKTARIAWALMVKSGTYRAPALTA
jgi:transposase